jgi:hypothetical protein
VPIALVPSPETAPTVGVIRGGDECFEKYRDCVDRVVQRGFARFPV